MPYDGHMTRLWVARPICVAEGNGDLNPHDSRTKPQKPPSYAEKSTRLETISRYSLFALVLIPASLGIVRLRILRRRFRGPAGPGSHQ
jgi:hypothetical protein